MDEVGLGKRIQEMRRRGGLTQQDLCHKAQLSYSTLAKIERGAIKSPSIFTIQAVASSLGISLDELVGNSLPGAGKTISKKTSKSGIRFIYFDINGCLVRFFHRAFSMIGKDSGEAADVIESTFWHNNDAVCKGEMPISEFNHILGKKFGLKDFDWRNYYMRAIEPVKEMKELIEWASDHYEIGLISNIMPGQIEQMLKEKIIPDVPYDLIIDSSEVKAIKPEPKIYEIALQKCGKKANEVLLIDDSRVNITAADKQGWRVLWFDDFNPNESIKRIRSALSF